MTAFVVRAPATAAFETIDVELLGAFRALRDALASGRAAVVVLSDTHVAAHGEPADAALAHALLGLVRSLATEGARAGWVINALSVADGIDPEPWIERLGDPGELRGGLIRLGDGHLGRIPA
jgi:NAD(P)-dependent dehydrogenase (short-subunit alcohol dehydrogenase family)